jgi:uncharacterized protein (TIGR02266 family)
MPIRSKATRRRSKASRSHHPLGSSSPSSRSTRSQQRSSSRSSHSPPSPPSPPTSSRRHTSSRLHRRRRRAAGQPQQGQPVPAGYRGNQNREKIEVNIGATTESNFFVGFSTEISEGGVFAATYNIQPRGTPMLVHITLPGGFDRIVQGVVKFVRDPMDMSADDTVPGMGIQFEGLDPEGRDLILRFIRKRPPMFYDE